MAEKAQIPQNQLTTDSGSSSLTQGRPLQVSETQYPKTAILETEVGKALIADEEIQPNEKIFCFSGLILSKPSMHTLQLDESKHILCSGGPEYTSHSCEPNGYFLFDGGKVELIALRKLAKGEPVSFDYNTTEWDMSCKFKCMCKSTNCHGFIQGYKHLSPDRRKALEKWTSPFIKAKAAQEALDKLSLETAMTLGKVKSKYPKTAIIETEVGKALVAQQEIEPNQRIFRFAGRILPTPNMHTLQLEETKHILCTDGPEFTSHSCDPNSYFVFDGDVVELISLRKIATDEPISFDYNTTEWDISVKFKCCCKSEKCYGYVQGFKHLNPEQRKELEKFVSPFIRAKADKEALIESGSHYTSLDKKSNSLFS